MLVAQSCPTLFNSVDCSLPGSSVHGVFRARILEWVAIPFSRRSSWPRDRTQADPVLQADSLPSEPKILFFLPVGQVTKRLWRTTSSSAEQKGQQRRPSETIKKDSPAKTNPSSRHLLVIWEVKCNGDGRGGERLQLITKLFFLLQ